MRRLHRFLPRFRLPMIIGGIIIAIGFAFLFGFFVMLLWNWLMPTIFGLGVITYWQAWGLVLLAHLLFKIGGPREHFDHHDEFWKERFRRKFSESKAEPKPDNEQNQSA